MKTRIAATLLVTAIATTVAVGQQVTPIWVQHINGTVNIAPGDELGLVFRRPGPVVGYPSFAVAQTGQFLIRSFGGFHKYDDAHYLLTINENGINELTETDPARLAAAAAAPDRSLIWIDAATGKNLGIAHVVGVVPPTAFGPPTQRAAGSNKISFESGLDEGPYGEKVIFTGFEHRLLRWADAGTVVDANFPLGRPIWATTPTLAYVQPVPNEAAPTIVPGERGTEPGLAGGDQSDNWRWESIRAYGHGETLRVYAGGSTWRASMHREEFVTDDGGLTLRPIARSSCRDGGNKGNYSQGGEYSGVRLDANDPSRPGVEWYIHGRYPGTGYGARPSRMVRNPNQTILTENDNIKTNRFLADEGNPDTQPWAMRQSYPIGDLPSFCWEAAGTCGNFGPNQSKDPVTGITSGDGIDWYDGNWSIVTDTKDGLDYIVTYAMPAWNQQFGGYPNGIAKPGWVGVHTLDGKLAPNANAWKLPCTEWDELLSDQLGTGHGFGYAASMEVNPDAEGPAGAQKSTVLVAFGEYGFGVFSVEIKPVDGTLSAPANDDTSENRPIALTSTYTGGGTPLFYKWQKDNAGTWQDLAGRSGNVARMGLVQPVTYSIDLAQLSDSGSYRLVVYNQLSEVASDPATVTVAADNDPPVVVGATSIDGTSVVVFFDELLNSNDVVPDGIFDIFSYWVEDITGGGDAGFIGDPQLMADGKSIRLVLNPAFPLTGNFRVSVGALQDLKGNSMAVPGVPNTAAGQFANGTVYSGGVYNDMKIGANPQGFYWQGLDGNIEVLTGGTDIWGAADGLTFLYKEVSGNFDYQVQVKDSNRNDNRSGLMVRASLDPGSEMVGSLTHGRQEPSQTLVGSFVRLIPGATPAWISPANNWDFTFHKPDVWVRLIRQGNIFRSGKSHNGTDWEYDGQVELGMADPVLLGLASTSFGGTSTSRTTYSNFTLGVGAVTGRLVVSSGPGTRTLSWPAGSTLQSTTSLSPTDWQDEVGAVSPLTLSLDGPQKFYRSVIQ